MYQLVFASKPARQDGRQKLQTVAGATFLLGCFLFLTNVCLASPTEPPDFNDDGKINFTDFLILSRNFGHPGTIADGDANGDGNVNFADFLILSAQFDMESMLHGIWDSKTKELHIHLSGTTRARISTELNGRDIIVKLEDLDDLSEPCGIKSESSMAVTVKADEVKKIIVYGTDLADTIDLSGVKTDEFKSMQNYPSATRAQDTRDVDGDRNTTESFVFSDVEIYGKGGDDQITGSRFNDYIDAGKGSDTVATHGGPQIWQQGRGTENLNRESSPSISGDIYVDSIEGDDHHSGDSPGAPLWSIQTAVNMAGPKSRIWVEGGGGRTYPVPVRVKGKSDLTIRGRNGIPVIDGETIANNHTCFFDEPQTLHPLSDEPAAATILLPPRFRRRNTVDSMITWSRRDKQSPYLTRWVGTAGLLTIVDSTSVVIQDLKIQNSRHAGITVINHTGPLNVEDITIESCEIENTRGHGIMVYTEGDDNGVSQNITIKNCKISRVCEGFAEADVPVVGGLPSSQGEAVRVAQSNNVLIHGNEIKDHRKEGIDLHEHVTNAHVYDNYIGRRAATRYNITQGAAIYLDPGEPSAPPTQNVNIYRNLIETDSPGITLGSERGGHMHDIWIYNNLVNTAGNCFKISDTTNPGVKSGNKKNVRVYHNTFVNWLVGSGPQHVCFIKESDHRKLDGLEFKNNIVARNFDTATFLFSIKDDPKSVIEEYIAISHNVYWDPSPGSLPGQQGTDKFPGDPAFRSGYVEVGGAQRAVEYWVNSKGVGHAKAVNLGRSPNYLDKDIRRVTRPTNLADIGAFED